MGLRSWFGTAEQKETEKAELRSDVRLSVHAEVLVSADPQPSDDRLKRADLVDFASGGLQLRMDAPVKVGQTVWVRTTVAHVSQHESSTELGVTWDLGKPSSQALPASKRRQPTPPSPAGEQTSSPETVLASRGD